MVCSNCVDSGKTANEYKLRIRGRDDDLKIVNMSLCDVCISEFLSLSWITEESDRRKLNER